MTNMANILGSPGCLMIARTKIIPRADGLVQNNPRPFDYVFLRLLNQMQWYPVPIPPEQRDPHDWLFELEVCLNN